MSRPTPSPEARDNAVMFLFQYGNFLVFWSTFEIVVEVVIMRQLGTDPERTSIVCGGLGIGAKMAILCSLLNRTAGNEKGVALFKEAQTLAERNSFAHGFFLVTHATGGFELIKREVKDTYRARVKQFDADLMDTHSTEFIRKVEAIQRHFAVSEKDLHDYTKQIEAHALAHPSQGKPRPSPQTNSSKAKRK
jgi:hypothetical protein